MKSERLYRKEVNKNGWMVKLQRLCFGGATPKFIGYCPFFWFTWFCLLFFIIIVPVRFLVSSFVGALSGIAELRSRKPSRPKDSLLLTFYDHYLETGKNVGMGQALAWEIEHNFETFSKVLNWINKTPDWENCAIQAWNRREAKKQQSQERSKRNVQRAKKLSGLAIWIGRTIKPILVIAGLLVSYKVGRFVYRVILSISWKELIYGAEIALGIFVGAGTVLLIINGVNFTVLWYQRCPKRPDKVGWIKSLYRLITKPLWLAGEFILGTIETIYTRECPLIEWGDESGPITSRVSKGVEQ